MSESGLKLAYPPIVEAVLDIECDVPPAQQLGELEQSALAQFRDGYPVLQKQFAQDYAVQLAPNAAPAVSPGSGARITALQFLQEDKKQLVQVREQGFSFNRLAPYGSFDDYVPEIARRWRQYIEVAAPVAVRTIRLRYINRIRLPTDGGRVELGTYFRFPPQLPEPKEFTLTGFLQQYQAVEINTGHQINLVITPQPMEGDKLPVILDNGVAVQEKGEPDNWDWILDQISKLRVLKNRIFQRELTEQCLNLFRQ